MNEEDLAYDCYNDWNDNEPPAIDYSQKVSELGNGDDSDATVVYIDDEIDEEVMQIVRKPSIFDSKVKSNLNNDVITLESSNSPVNYQHEPFNNDVPSSPLKLNNKHVKKTKEDKESQKAERDKVREEKKLEKLREKQLKATMTAQVRSQKPEEALKRLTVHIDTEIVNSGYGAQIIPFLQKDEITYRVESLQHSNTITWSKIIRESFLDDNNELIQIEKHSDIDQLVKVVGIESLVSDIINGDLLVKAKTLILIRPKVRLTIIIIGMEKYLTGQKSKLNKALKAAVAGSQPTKEGRRKKNDIPALSEEDIEMALTELQLLTNTCHKCVENPDGVAAVIYQLTRSISQIEYKREKYGKDGDSLSFFAKGDNKDCVRVDKNGNGLMQLWLQQLCQFNNVGLEVAQAIVSQYGSPQQLLAAYNQCCDRKQASALLENIPVRREAGILSSSRRIGPEISKKIYRFFTSEDYSMVL